MVGDGQYASLFVTNWFLELYYAVLPFPLMLRVWDMFLIKGPTIIYATGLVRSSLLSPPTSWRYPYLRLLSGSAEHAQGQVASSKRYERPHDGHQANRGTQV